MHSLSLIRTWVHMHTRLWVVRVSVDVLEFLAPRVACRARFMLHCWASLQHQKGYPRTRTTRGAFYRETREYMIASGEPYTTGGIPYTTCRHECACTRFRVVLSRKRAPGTNCLAHIYIPRIWEAYNMCSHGDTTHNIYMYLYTYIEWYKESQMEIVAKIVPHLLCLPSLVAPLRSMLHVYARESARLHSQKIRKYARNMSAMPAFSMAHITRVFHTKNVHSGNPDYTLKRVVYARRLRWKWCGTYVRFLFVNDACKLHRELHFI